MDLAAIIVATLALVISVMALPTVFQMFWGGPIISVQLAVADLAGNGKVLRCYVVNEPVRNRFLRWLRIVRQATEVLADFSVVEAGSGTVILNRTRAKLRTDKEHALQVTVSSFLPAIVPIAVHANGITEILRDDDSKAPITLDRGKYRISLDIIHSHDKIFGCSAEFAVGKTKDEIYWCTELPVITRRE